MNKKGFMMAEVIVVSVIVMTALSGLYITYNKIYKRYNTILNYYDAVSIYRAAYYRDALIENNKFNDLLIENTNTPTLIYRYRNNTDEGAIASINDSLINRYQSDVVFLAYNGKNKQLSNEVIDNIKNSDIHVTFKDYLDYLREAVDFSDTNYVMIIEHCNPTNEDDCQYGYLQVYDGKE